MSRPDERGGPRIGYYIYGIVPADVRLDDEGPGIGQPPARVELVRHAGIAALCSPIPLDRPIGEPADLLAHAKLLDHVAAGAAVLPFRFGAVVASRTAVIDELLAGDHDAFAAALDDLRGHVEYVVRARFVERSVLAQTLSEVPEIARLRDEIRARPGVATRDQQLRLGQLVSEAIEAKRAQTTQALVEALAPVDAASAVRPPTHEMDAAHVAYLVKTADRAEFERAVEDIARKWRDYATVRLLGPVAPYDFVTALPAASSARG